MADLQSTLRIRVLEDSRECSVFVVNVSCSDPLLLRFWCRRKPPFNNGQVEQTDVSWVTTAAEAEEGAGGSGSAELSFVLRALNRAPDLPNGHYWGPFVLALCLDARLFRFRLPEEALSGGHMQEIMAEHGALTLCR